MSASIKKKVSQNRTKLQQTTKQQQNNNKTTTKQQQNNNKTTTKQQQNNNKRPFFLPKKKVFLRPILQNLKGRSVLDKFFFENDPLNEPKQMPPSKKIYLFKKLVKNAKWWSKSNLPLSHSPDRNIFPFKKDFFKCIGCSYLGSYLLFYLSIVTLPHPTPPYQHFKKV